MLFRSLGDLDVAVLANHGIAAAGRTVVDAVYFAVEFDRAVRMQALAQQMGPLRITPPEELAQLIPYLSNAAKGRAQGVWDWMLRQVANAEQGRVAGRA